MSAALWAETKAQRVRAERALARLPLSETGNGAQVPFPFVDRKGIKGAFTNAQINAAIRKASVERVPLEGLKSIQHSVKPARVRQYLANPAMRPPGDENAASRTPVDHPIVIEHAGERLLWDGNHRTTAAYLTGAKDIEARLVKLGGDGNK